jgi:branched-chain amino acid transport system substrate-binding protein
MNLNRRLLLTASLAAVLSPRMARSQTSAIKVGVMNALTGVYAFGGVPLQNGMRLALRQANENRVLGDNTIEIIEADSAGDKGQTITLVSRLAQPDKVLMILGPTTSLEATGGAPVANELKVPMFTTGSSKAILDAGPYAMKFQPTGIDIMGHLADYAIDKLHVRRVTLVFDRANEGLVVQKDGFATLIRPRGAEIISEEGILSSDTDFLALGTKLASQDIDAFFIAAPAEVGANVLVQARQAGVNLSIPCLGPSGFASDSFIATAGKLANNSFVVADYFAGDPSEANLSFVKAYQAAYKVRPDNWAGMGYALGTLAVQALKDAGPNPNREKIKDALHMLKNQPTIMGNHVWTTDDNRNPQYGAAILTVTEGMFQLAPR